MPRGDNHISGGKTAAQELIQSGIPFSAIFSSNDAMAIGAMRALLDSGYRIPNNVSIVGVDDIILASYCEPPLTTVTQPKYDAGCQAMSFLIERIGSGYNQGPRNVLLNTELVQRNSCIPFSETTKMDRTTL
ncbi:MAG: LacI family transcriptional regulator, partial [Chloroflexi bacterium]